MLFVDQAEELITQCERAMATRFADALVSAGVLLLRRSQPELPRPFRCPGVPLVPLLLLGQAVAVAYAPDGRLVVQTREPPALHVRGADAPVALGGESRNDTGHTIFHSNAGAFLACASCHPEGHEDGRTWHFDLIGARRTQEVGNDVLQTAPLHWDGDMTDLGAIMTEVFVHRMGGSPQGERHIDAFSHWMSSMPKVKISATTASVKSIEHGQALFNDAAVGCATLTGASA